MKKTTFLILSMIITIIIFISPLAQSSPLTCGANNAERKEVRKLLIEFRLEPGIYSHRGLIEGIRLEYGEPLADKLLEIHPYFKRPRDIISLETMQWLRDDYFNKQYSYSNKYLLVPFYHSLEGHGALTLIHELAKRSYPKFLLSPIFFSSSQMKEVKLRMKENNHFLLTEHLMSIYHLSNFEAKIAAMEIYEKIFKNKEYLLANDLKKIIHGQRIIIAGIGVGDSEFGLNFKKISFEDLVSYFKRHELPINVAFEVDSCYAACEIDDENTNFSSEELISKFISNEMDSAFGEKKQGLAYRFSKYLFTDNHWPEYNGHIVQYYGNQVAVPQYTLTIDPDDPSKVTSKKMFGVIAFTKTREKMYFDPLRMWRKISKSDFIPIP